MKHIHCIIEQYTKHYGRLMINDDMTETNNIIKKFNDQAKRTVATNDNLRFMKTLVIKEQMIIISCQTKDQKRFMIKLLKFVLFSYTQPII